MTPNEAPRALCVNVKHSFIHTFIQYVYFYSSIVCQVLPSAAVKGPGGVAASASSHTEVVVARESELILLLKVQLAEAINLQDKDLVAQLHETIRCLKQFDINQYVARCQ